MYSKYTKAKAELFSIEKKIREAEKNAESDYVQELRKKKEAIDRKIESIYRDIAAKEAEKEKLSDEIIANKKAKRNLV